MSKINTNILREIHEFDVLEYLGIKEIQNQLDQEQITNLVKNFKELLFYKIMNRIVDLIDEDLAEKLEQKQKEDLSQEEILVYLVKEKPEILLEIEKAFEEAKKTLNK